MHSRAFAIATVVLLAAAATLSDGESAEPSRCVRTRLLICAAQSVYCLNSITTCCAQRGATWCQDRSNYCRSVHWERTEFHCFDVQLRCFVTAVRLERFATAWMWRQSVCSRQQGQSVLHRWRALHCGPLSLSLARLRVFTERFDRSTRLCCWRGPLRTGACKAACCLVSCALPEGAVVHLRRCNDSQIRGRNRAFASRLGGQRLRLQKLYGHELHVEATAGLSRHLGGHRCARHCRHGGACDLGVKYNAQFPAAGGHLCWRRSDQP